MACADQFAILIIGADVECTLTVTDDSKSFGIEKLIDATGDDPLTLSPTIVTAVGFTYTVGSPARSVFASSWSSARSGAAGSPKPLGGISFTDPASPDLSGASNEVKTGEVTVGLPIYTQAEADALGTGQENYTVTLYLRKSDEGIAGSPSNLNPPNP